MQAPSIHPTTSVGHLAATLAGASRVFHRFGVDFCCGGGVALKDACERRAVAVDEVVAALEAESARSAALDDFNDWSDQPLGALIDFLLERFHAGHRAELPRLIEMAAKVERVHADKPACPTGLTAHLERMLEELEDHMQKEEQILFPLIQSGRGRMAFGPVSVMEQEHQDHGQNLARLRAFAHDFTAPPEACGTWLALYLGLAELEEELMHHIHLENNVLFPRALRE